MPLPTLLTLPLLALAAPSLAWEMRPDPLVTGVSPYALAHVEGGRIVVGGGGVVEAWDPGTGARAWQVPGDRTFVRSVAAVPGRPWVVTGGDSGAVRVLDATDGRVIHTLALHLPEATVTSDLEVVPREEWVMGVDVSDDGLLVAAAGIDGSLGLWGLDDGARVALPDDLPTARRLEEVAFLPDGRLAVAGDFGADGAVVLVEPGGAAVQALPVQRAPERAYAQSIDVSPDGRRLAVGSWGGGLQVHDLRAGEVLWSVRASESWAGPVRFTPDGRHVIVSAPDALTVHEADSGEVVARREGAWGSGISVAPGGDEVVVAHHAQARLRRWSLPDLDPLDPPDAVLAGARHLAFSADGRALAVGSDNAPDVVVHDTASGQVLGRWEVRCVGPAGLRWDRQGRHLAVSSCDYDEGFSVARWPGLRPVRGLQGLATNGEAWFTADGEHLVVMDAFAYAAPRVYAVPSGRQASARSLPDRWLDPRGTSDLDVAAAQWGYRSLTPNHWLNAAGPSWDLASTPPAPPPTAVPEPDLPDRREPPRTTRAASPGGYSLDGRRTVQVAGASVSVLQDGRPVQTLDLGRDGALAAAIGPGGDQVAVSFRDGGLQLWRLDASPTR